MSHNGDFLFDTNAIIAIFNDQSLLKQLNLAAKLRLPCIVVGELAFGAYKSANPAQNLKRIQDLLEISTVLDCDQQTGHHYGAVKSALRKKGHPIPDNDIWIAAVAIQYELPLLTNDKHFHEVDGLAIVNW